MSANGNGRYEWPEDWCLNCCKTARFLSAEGLCSKCNLALGYSSAEVKAKDHMTLRALDTRALLTTEPEPLYWLADGIWCRGKLTLFGGREKGGKSLVQLALAVCIASGGGEVAGVKVEGGQVLLIDAENGEREIHRRLRAAGLDAEHSDRLHIAEARGFDLRDDLAEVERLIDAHRPDLVILDSFRSLWRGNERDEAEVSEALDPVRHLAHDRDIAVGLTHHAQKNGDEYRGSTGIGAAVEWVAMLSRVRDDENRTRRRLTTPLARFAPERPDRWLAIKSGGDDGPVWLESAEAYSRPRPRDDKTQAVLDALTGDVQAEREIAREVELPRTTVQRILRDLQEDRLADKRSGGWVAHMARPHIEVGHLGHPGEGDQ